MAWPTLCSYRVALGVRLVYASIGVLIGLSVFPVFLVTFKNPPAAYWGLVSALFASLTLLLFIHLYVIVRPPTKPPLRVLLLFTGVLSAVGVAAGVAGFATYLGLGITSTVDGDDERPLFETEYIVCVWTFMTSKWAVTSFYYSTRSLKRQHLPLTGNNIISS